MVGCELLDFRCIFVSELIGNMILTVIFLAIIFLIIASKLRFGFETTIIFAVPLLLVGGLAIGGFSAIYAFLTFIISITVAYLFNKIIGNK